MWMKRMSKWRKEGEIRGRLKKGTINKEIR